MTSNRLSIGTAFRRASSLAMLLLVSMAASLPLVGCTAGASVNLGAGGAGGSSGGGQIGAGGTVGGTIVLGTLPVTDAASSRPNDGICGDGILQRSEQCDDSNTTGGDG